MLTNQNQVEEYVFSHYCLFSFGGEGGSLMDHQIINHTVQKEYHEIVIILEDIRHYFHTFLFNLKFVFICKDESF